MSNGLPNNLQQLLDSIAIQQQNQQADAALQAAYAQGAQASLGEISRALNEQTENYLRQKENGGTAVLGTSATVQPQQQQVEPPDAKQIIDMAVLRPESPNQYEWGIKRGILDAKQLYANAQEGESGDVQRRRASDTANALRRVAQSVGLDLGGLGDGSGSSLEDATIALESQMAREIMEAQRGQYSLTANEYYQRDFEDGIMSGLSARRARKRAERNAEEYQARRNEYLTNLLESHGRDGLVTNSIGNWTIGQLAGSDPALANFYAQIYPNAKDAYAQENQLVQLALTDNNARDRLLIAAALDDWRARNQFERQEQGKNADVGRGVNLYTGQREVDLGYQLALDEGKYQQTLQHIQSLPENMREQALLSLHNILGNGKGGRNSDSQAKDMKDFVEAFSKAKGELIKQRDSLIKQHEQQAWDEGSTQQLKEIDEKLNQYDEAILNATGLGEPRWEFDPDQTDEQILANYDLIFSTAGQRSYPVTRDKIKQLLENNNAPGAFIKRVMALIDKERHTKHWQENKGGTPNE